MTTTDPYQELRDIWDDYNHRQEFEHELLDRKTTWLLTSQTILFAAYGVTFGASQRTHGLGDFRRVVAWAGLITSVVVFLGILALVRAKYLSWRAYRAYYEQPRTPDPPKPIGSGNLQWGVHSWTTVLALTPDCVIPLVFARAWYVLAT